MMNKSEINALPGKRVRMIVATATTTNNQYYDVIRSRYWQFEQSTVTLINDNGRPITILADKIQKLDYF